MSDTTTPSDKQPSPEGEVEIHIVFDYVIQRVPTRTKRKVLTRKQDFNVHMKLSRTNLDERGYPNARALWAAERVFLKGYNDKHLPDVRMLQWKSHLKGDSYILSGYRALLPPSLD
jgi:hypothetical protein